MKIIFATGNQNKMKEIRMILEDLGMEILSMKEAGVYVDVEENGTTFEENALIKASGSFSFLVFLKNCLLCTLLKNGLPHLETYSCVLR